MFDLIVLGFMYVNIEKLAKRNTLNKGQNLDMILQSESTFSGFAKDFGFVIVRATSITFG